MKGSQCREIKDRIRLGSFTPKQREELEFWLNIRANGFRGFAPEEWRLAHIHFKQYSLLYINRSIGDLEGKVVIEVGCGPAGIIPYINNATAIGVDPLIGEYKKMWDLFNDKVKYICSEIETFKTDIEADVVICWNVLDHVSIIELAVKKLSEILKPYGELWILINLEDMGDSSEIVKVDINSAHPFKVNEKSISLLMEKCGFFWKEKIQINNCLKQSPSVLMAVLGKNILGKEKQR